MNSPFEQGAGYRKSIKISSELHINTQMKSFALKCIETTNIYSLTVYTTLKQGTRGKSVQKFVLKTFYNEQYLQRNI